ncbi:MAG TPA: asparagine synthase (glutamine-hydrolyzing) [Candidatus Binatia bacterium]|nr:asparagine synthase (glutamine-hydrolyzing) [Candidatus Binatia bacterium]
MCGIYGILDFCRVQPRGSLLSEMGEVVRHRGPDDHGVYSSPPVALGMRRLSIIDLKGGHQPIANEMETVWVVCNGEIYNFRELRGELEKNGHQFRTHSDTEVIVHLYEDLGVELFKRLRGMFAIAIWDAKRKRLVLARDRLGKKPLYVAQLSDRLLFASEIKAILADPTFPRELDFSALGEYLALGYVPAPSTLFKGIEKLPPGHYLIAEEGRVSQHRYWQIDPAVTDDLPEEEWVERIREKLLESVRIRLVSDVPLGAFLSGGIDSSAIVAAMARMTDQPVKTYSIGFDGEDSFYNELPYARIVARTFGTDHHEIIVRPQVAELLPELIWHMDEPIADSAFVTTYLVSRLAAQSVKVILSGVGGDELFGGYRRYLGDSLGRYYELLPGLVRQHWLPSVLARLPRDRHSRWKNFVRYAEAFAKSANLKPSDRYLSYVTLFTPEAANELFHHGPNGAATTLSLQRYFQECAGAESLNRYIYVDLKTSLADDLLALTDKMTMAMSLECRAPFMDHELVELAMRMPAKLKVRGFTMKYLLKKAVQPWLPAGIIRRKKRGFGAPMGAWLRRDLKRLAEETLSERVIRKRGLLQWPVVKRLRERHEREEGDYTDHLLALINLELWLRQFLDRPVRPRVSDVATA